MDIALYLVNVLKEHDEVTLPGIGTFYKHKVAAKYNTLDKCFHPPGVEIAFSTDQKSNNYLRQYISAEKSISDASADYFIEKYAGEVKSELEAKGEYSLYELGSLHTSDSGIQFTGYTSVFSPQNFGLTAVAEPEYVSTEPQAQQADQQAHADGSAIIPTEDTDAEATQNAASIEALQIDTLTENSQFEDTNTTVQAEEDTPDEDVPGRTQSSSDIFDVFNESVPLYQKPEKAVGKQAFAVEPTDEEYIDEPKGSRGWIKVSIALLVMVCLFCTGYFYRTQLEHAFNKYKTLLTSRKQPAIPVTKQKNSADRLKLSDSVAKQALAVEKLPDSSTAGTADTINQVADILSYEIIGPTFSNRKRAKAFINRMKLKKVDAYIVDSIPGLRVKVSFGSFKTETDAKQHLPDIQKNIFKDSYIQPIKNQQ